MVSIGPIEADINQLNGEEMMKEILVVVLSVFAFFCKHGELRRGIGRRELLLGYNKLILLPSCKQPVDQGGTD